MEIYLEAETRDALLQRGQRVLVDDQILAAAHAVFADVVAVFECYGFAVRLVVKPGTLKDVAHAYIQPHGADGGAHIVFGNRQFAVASAAELDHRDAVHHATAVPEVRYDPFVGWVGPLVQTEEHRRALLRAVDALVLAVLKKIETTTPQLSFG